MFNIYYKIWVDAIVFQQTKYGNERSWKFFTLIPISAFQGFNVLTVVFWISVISGKNIPIFFDVNVFSIKPLNSF
jgi:hypothetical protein